MNVTETNGRPIKAWTDGVPVEPEAMEQVKRLAEMPFIYKHVALMADVHKGIGATVGSVIATQGAVIPAAVGVDIGCGMNAVRLNLTASDLPDSLAHVRSAIETAVPHGRTDNGGANDRGAWGTVPDSVGLAFADETSGVSIERRLSDLLRKHPRLERSAKRSPHQLGTLGGGNHFIELCLDENQGVWVMLHSGSRGIGNAIGSHFIEVAKQEMERWFIHLPDADLAYLPEGSEHFDDYVEAVGWAQDFAFANRQVMMASTIAAVSKALGRPVEATGEATNCHHNYLARESHFGRNVLVTRKGAVRAREGDMGIIPGSMGAKSFIVRGKGNADSFHSCSHGAGRVMSRTAARKAISVDDHIAATAGVECRKDADVVDESPAAYKDIDRVIEAQAELIDVVATLKQVLCVKG